MQEQMTKSCLLYRTAKFSDKLLQLRNYFLNLASNSSHLQIQVDWINTNWQKQILILNLIDVDNRGVKTREFTRCNYVKPWSFQQVCVSWWSAQLHNTMTHSLPPQGALVSHHCMVQAVRMYVTLHSFWNRVWGGALKTPNKIKCMWRSYSNIFISTLIVIWCIPQYTFCDFKPLRHSWLLIGLKM